MRKSQSLHEKSQSGPRLSCLILRSDFGIRCWKVCSEIRSRALISKRNRFYTRSQDEYLELFRLFRFLLDQQGMSDIIVRAELSCKMAVMAKMVASNTRATYLTEADKWVNLADQMRGEMREVGSLPPEAQSLPLYTRENVVSTDIDI